MRCACGRLADIVWELNGALYCEYCSEKPCCSVCGETPIGNFYELEKRIICKKCYRPEYCCFSCGRQTIPGREMRLADFRIICPVCYVDAVFLLDESIIANMKFKLVKMLYYPVVQPEFEVVSLDRLMVIKGNSNKTVTGNCFSRLELCGSYKRVLSHKISVLFGLPREQCLCTLAHELFHAWLHENTEPDAISNNESEWLCEHAAWRFSIVEKFAEQWQRKALRSRDAYIVSDSFQRKILSLRGSQLLDYLRSGC